MQDRVMVFNPLHNEDIIFKALGGVSEVGATSYYINWKGIKILIDSGKRQGYGKITPEYDEVDRDLDILFITHVHQDHVGSLIEAIDYFNIDKIIATNETKAALVPILNDSMKILLKGRSVSKEMRDLYSVRNIEYVISRIDVAPYNKLLKYKKLNYTLLHTSHLIGSMGILLEDRNYSLFLTSDYTESKKFFHPHTNFSNVYGRHIDTMITESTYGHDEESEEVLQETTLDNLELYINSIFNSSDENGNYLGGNILIPAFSAGRTQEVILALLVLIKRNRIPYTTEICVPFNLYSERKSLSLLLTSLYYTKYKHLAEEELGEGLPNLFKKFVNKYLKTFNYRKDIENFYESKNQILIGSPGMLGKYSEESDGDIFGSIRVALDFIQSKRHGIIFVGYMAPGTLGNIIQNTQYKNSFRYSSHNFTRETLHIYKVTFPGHVSAKGFMDTIKRVKPKNLIITHGDISSSLNLARTVVDSNINVIVPEIEESIYLLDNSRKNFFSTHHKYTNIIISLDVLEFSNGFKLEEPILGNVKYYNLKIIHAIEHILKDKPATSHIDIVIRKNEENLLFYKKLEDEITDNFGFSIDIITIDRSHESKEIILQEIIEFISEKALSFKEKFDIYMLYDNFIINYPLFIVAQLLNNKIYIVDELFNIVSLPLFPIDIDKMDHIPIKKLNKMDMNKNTLLLENGHLKSTASDFYELFDRIIKYKNLGTRKLLTDYLPNQLPKYNRNSIFFKKDIFALENISLWGEVENIYDIKNNKAIEILMFISSKLNYDIKEIQFTSFLQNYDNHSFWGEILGYDEEHIYYKMVLENGIQFFTIRLAFNSNPEDLIIKLGLKYE